MAKQGTRRVIFQPAAARRMLCGIDQLVDAVRPTLGPLPRCVAIERPTSGQTPELLDNGGIIARRVVELPDRDEDMGAMLLRNLLWRLNDQVGDGTATAAVLFQSVYRQGVHYLASGGNAMQLRRHLEIGLAAMLSTLDNLTLHLREKERLAQIAESICHDPPLAHMIGEIFDVIGEYGRLEIKKGHSRTLEREYTEGMYWNSAVLSPYMLPDHVRKTVHIDHVALLLTDLDIDDPYELVPVLELAMQAGLRNLVIVARQLSSRAIALLLLNQKPEGLHTIAVRTPGVTNAEKADALEDMALATGGHPIWQAAGQTLRGVTLDDLGYARQAWANTAYFGIIGGQGDPRVLRSHLTALRSALRQTEDQEARKALQQRLGRLMGGSATLSVGGATDSEIAARLELAQRTADAMRGAVIEGVLPGGGVALLMCQPVLRRLHQQSTDVDERAAYRILIEAVEAPIRTILSNAGIDVGEALANVALAGTGCGCDVRSGQVVDVVQAGIFDVAAVQKAALRSAVAGAALALTIDVLIHRKQPKMATASSG